MSGFNDRLSHAARQPLRMELESVLPQKHSYLHAHRLRIELSDRMQRSASELLAVTR